MTQTTEQQNQWLIDNTHAVILSRLPENLQGAYNPLNASGIIHFALRNSEGKLIFGDFSELFKMAEEHCPEIGTARETELVNWLRKNADDLGLILAPVVEVGKNQVNYLMDGWDHKHLGLVWASLKDYKENDRDPEMFPFAADDLLGKYASFRNDGVWSVLVMNITKPETGPESFQVFCGEKPAREYIEQLISENRQAPAMH